MKIFFNSSMPRSGSTLMQNILGNNPKIYATPTSALLDMLNASRRVYTNSPSVKAQDEIEMRKGFLMYSRFAVEGFFHGITDRPYAIDKSRGWVINLPYLESFCPEPKIICVVRDLRDIVASMEKNHRKSPEMWDVSLEDSATGVTLGERIGVWLSPNAKPVGNTLNNLREMINRYPNLEDKVCFVRFEDLCAHPENVMKAVYEYLELDYFPIDYNNIKQVTFEDDKFHGKYGDHKIKSSVQPVKSYAKELLGDVICNQLVERHRWYFEYFNYV